MIALKYLGRFRRALKIPLIISKINLVLTWSVNYVISNVAANLDTTFAITKTNFYFPVVILSTQDNAKLLQQLKSGFKFTISWNKYH